MSRAANLRRLMRVLIRREEGRCFYCDEVVSMAARNLIATDAKRARELRAATVDHVIPASRGGEDTVENTVCACFGCNTDRKDRPAVDFLYEQKRKRRSRVEQMFGGVVAP